jgi:acyl-CoA synthetase (AMP-forming)/AMP-acid ligase II
MRLACSAGSSFDASVARDYHKLGFTVLQAYGLTETSGAATATRFEDNRVGFGREAARGVEIRIDEPNTDGIGEVLIRGPIVMPGYHGYTRRRMHWHSPLMAGSGREILEGSTGMVDLYITGRKKEIIVLPSGKNVYPEEVEGQYLKSPLVSEVCVMGVRDAREPFCRGGEAVSRWWYRMRSTLNRTRSPMRGTRSSFISTALGGSYQSISGVALGTLRADRAAAPRTPTRAISDGLSCGARLRPRGAVAQTRR